MEEFLAQAMGNENDLIRFLQQMVRLLPDGHTGEHPLMFIYGPGGNGKGVFGKRVQKAAPGDEPWRHHGDFRLRQGLTAIRRTRDAARRAIW